MHQEFEYYTLSVDSIAMQLIVNIQNNDLVKVKMHDNYILRFHYDV